ncbi:MAG TPA: DUF1707 domain-containing protein [Gaiellales bacterium]
MTGSERVADADRESAVVALREHAVAGRLTLEELAERVGSALAATTRGQLEGALGDLPAADPSQPEPADQRVVALFGDVSRSGRWRLGRRVRALGLFGGVRLDLRQAEVTAAEIWVEVDSICGAVEVIVPHGVALDVAGLAMFGAQHADAGDERPPPGAPLVHVKARSAFGSLTIRRG